MSKKVYCVIMVTAEFANSKRLKSRTSDLLEVFDKYEKAELYANSEAKGMYERFSTHSTLCKAELINTNTVELTHSFGVERVTFEIKEMPLK